MSFDPQIEYEIARGEARQAAFDSKDFDEFADKAGHLFISPEGCESFWDAYLKWDAKQDKKGGGN